MLKKIKINHKLLYFIDVILVIIIAYFLYHGFSRASEHNRQAQTKIDNTRKKLEERIQATEAPEPAKTLSELNGIDVSHYQGDVQWGWVADNYQFAFIKATEGSSYIDPRYQENIGDIASTSMLYGAYHFFNPDTDALTQAKHFVSSINQQHLLLPPVLDVEVEPSGSSRELRASVKTWLAHVEEKTGCRPIIYTNKHFWTRHFDDSFEKYPLWISAYSGNEDTLKKIPWEFWQYTEQGRVKGISGMVDKSRFYGNISQLNSLSCS